MQLRADLIVEQLHVRSAILDGWQGKLQRDVPCQRFLDQSDRPQAAAAAHRMYESPSCTAVAHRPLRLIQSARDVRAPVRCVRACELARVCARARMCVSCVLFVLCVLCVFCVCVCV